MAPKIGIFQSRATARSDGEGAKSPRVVVTDGGSADRYSLRLCDDGRTRLKAQARGEGFRMGMEIWKWYFETGDIYVMAQHRKGG